MTAQKHMDFGSRNKRLCATLQKMGLYVVPIFSSRNPQSIDYLEVSAGLPAKLAQQVPEKAASTGVTAMVPSAKVGEVVDAAKSNGASVIDFPTVLRVKPVV